jgi:hypothetical protein
MNLDIIKSMLVKFAFLLCALIVLFIIGGIIYFAYHFLYFFWKHD